MCEHEEILFYGAEKKFKCSKCGEEVAKLISMKEYELFCKFLGINENTFLAKN